MPKPPSLPLRLLVVACVFVVTTALIAGFFGRWHPFFDSFAHFRTHLGMLLALSGIPLIFAVNRTHAAAAVLLGLAAAGTTLPPGSLSGFGAVHAAAPTTENQPTYKLMQFNLFHSNRTPEQVLSLIGRLRPDVVTLDEVSALWEPKLEVLKAAYPYQINCRVRRTGSAILSRRPFVEGREPRCFDRGSMVLTSVNFGGAAADVVALHLGWPWPYDQARQLDQLTGPLARIGETAILGGDFNATPWSFAAKRVMFMSGMEPATSGQRSWLPFALPRALRPLGLPIDHVLIKGGVEVRNLTILEPVGSDHWALLVEFALAPASGEPPAPVTVRAEGSAAISL
ncbi:MAG: endonuclease/exonuclease/phosphatase family protein [Rhizobiaceae bacterium]